MADTELIEEAERDLPFQLMCIEPLFIQSIGRTGNGRLLVWKSFAEPPIML